MAENRKDRESGLYYFSKGQLVVVATGFTATCVLVFLLGILIGQGLEERKLRKQEEPLVKVPLQPLTPGSKPGQGAPGKDELTFYDTLGKTPSGAQSGGRPPAKEAKAADKPAKPEVKPELKELTEAPEAKPAKEIKIAKTTATAEAPAAVQKAKTKMEKEAATEDNTPEPAQKPAEEAKTETAQRQWTVQVNAFPDERSAQRLVERLKQKGYDAYLVTANIKGRDWYRVRVGHFASRGQTKELLEDLQTKENFTKAIAVSR